MALFRAPFLPVLAVFASLVGAGCSSSDAGAPPAAVVTPKANERIGDIEKSEVWKDGFKLTGLVRIHEGATVEIEPGAKITCLASAAIHVGGTLRVKGGAKHATITCAQWAGILVAGKGQLDITGLDVENADVAIETTRGAGTVTLSDVSLTNTPRPFLIRADSTVTASKIIATTPTTLPDGVRSVSEVFGTLVGKYIDYSANTNEGIMVMRGGSADIEDSTLSGKNGLDLLSSYGGKSLKVRYTTMKGAHCGLHITESQDAEKAKTGSIEVDHVSSENLFGITIYALTPEGPHVVKDSNFKGLNSWIDLQGDHGPIQFTGIFTEGGETLLNTDPPVFGKVTARIANAQPR